MSLRRASALLLFACAGTLAQRLVETNMLAPELRDFNASAASTLNCQVIPMEPSVDFGFRFQTGYFVRVPMNQYLGAGHGWGILTRITPQSEGAKPVFLLSNFKLPEVPKTNLELELGGSYLLGRGRYKVDWLLLDDQGRTCRKQWTAEANLKGADRDVKLRIPDGAVWDYTRLAGPRESSTGKYRITVLVNAAPLSFRATKLRPYDRAILLGSLAALLESIPAKSVKISVFSLEKQQELFSEENFRSWEIGRIADSVDQLELRLIDYHVLQHRKGHVDLLADLINAELRSERPADAVIVLGPLSKFEDKMPQAALDSNGRTPPPFFYFQYRSRYRRGTELPDSIQSAMRRVKGKVSVIYTPRDFAKAIKQVEERLGELHPTQEP